MLELLIEKSLENMKDIKKICMIGNRRYIKHLEVDKLALNSFKINMIELDMLSFNELKNQVSKYAMDTLLVMVFPLCIDGYSRKEIFKWLMQLEEEGMYILNISVGVEYPEIDDKIEIMLAKLLKKIVVTDNSEMKRKNLFYYKLMNENKKMLITDTNGSRITFEVCRVIAENDYLDSENKVIQIPAGEVFVVPKKGSVNGVFVLKNKEGRKKISIEKDFVDLTFVDKSFYLPVGEVGFGTNPMIPEIWSLPYIEKKSGTYHLGFGRNKNFGGEYVYDIHFDLVSNSKEFSVEIYEENSN